MSAEKTAALIKPLQRLVVPNSSGRKHTATVIFLHGSGDTAVGVRHWLNVLVKGVFRFPHIRIVYPHAPQQPYTPLNGQLSNVWFDRRSIDANTTEMLNSVDVMKDRIHQLIEDEVRQGIPYHRIIIGGFSMGGAMALHAGYRYSRSLGGIFALSSFVPKDSAVFKELHSYKRSPPSAIVMSGDNDELVKFEWGVAVANTLKSLGIDCQFQMFEGLQHDMSIEEINILKEWIIQKLPE
ncbi:Lysophospholipase-like protein 1 [Trichoplax sp. H2]|uniref:palmitoyl-protein hydrolase n=1 Tax=Trichoplax adhaerens TaxID=10228 RepID=B3RIZ2_TRIAD|nr:hypothetical protein TRIADDRAFT_49569 [Trichoplax adhaerens]EDV29274.1 hypothetical protein TRIADDRAFT_49569 [Trichoplax adhaerens]RDD39241.1 Lysophospholipase-like protein 1 [Trichoplax sp. H2]|eukprot:XP_002108476.1 hypothetical protein TRIADDRAFT_49569 [Trichoplax adhaerens]